ncbi:thioredoxin-disulfide reductase [Nautilia lithotrophica]
MYDVIIIGAGPGGLSAGLYAGRMGLNTLIIEKLTPGGQITQSSEIENYPGVCEVKSGLELMQCWPEQTMKFGAKIISEEVQHIEKKDNIFQVKTSQNEYQSKAVILATGATPKRAGFKGEEEYIGKGVSYCAVCDGYFYKNMDVAVVGGGDSALEEALYLSNIAKKVYLIHRRDEFRASPLTIEKVKNKENIEILYNTTIEEVKGTPFLNTAVINQKGETKELKVDGVFVFVGMNVNSALVKDICELNEYGEVKVDLNMKTSLDGLYAIGDVRQNSVKQVVASAGDGSVAALNVVKYVKNLKV